MASSGAPDVPDRSAEVADESLLLEEPPPEAAAMPPPTATAAPVPVAIGCVFTNFLILPGFFLGVSLSTASLTLSSSPSSLTGYQGVLVVMPSAVSASIR